MLTLRLPFLQAMLLVPLSFCMLPQYLQHRRYRPLLRQHLVNIGLVLKVLHSDAFLECFQFRCYARKLHT